MRRLSVWVLAVASVSFIDCREQTASAATPAAPKPPVVATPEVAKPASPAVALVPSGPASDVASVPRPDREHFGLYLMGKKVGWLTTSAAVGPKADQFTLVNDYHFRVKVGTRTSERNMKETKTYEVARASWSRALEQSGDGGDQVLDGAATATGFRVLRKRPGIADETIDLPAAKEVVEDADQPRVALKRQAKVAGVMTDSTDLKQYQLTTTVEPDETRMLHGVKVKLHKTVTLSEKDKVPTEAWFDEKGRTVEAKFGTTMTAVGEPEDIAKRFDVVEVFGLTRVVLPKPAPPTARQVPGTLTLELSGLPEKFRTPNPRQKYRPLGGDKVEVTLTAQLPTKRARRPLIDPNGGTNLENTLAVETNNADIKALAKKIVGDEKDAWAASKKVSRWVYQNVKSDYGVSSDRSTDVLKTLKGDCTEHALLAVALLRAAGIPAKRVDGVVYVMNEDNVPALYWHEWVGAYVGEWTQLDPTFGQDVADATHLGLGEESDAEITPLIGSLKVYDVH